MSETEIKVIGKDFADDRKINRYRLDEESEIQSSLYGHYADLLGEAKTERDTAENALKVCKAKTELDLRRDPPPDVKITETSIKALVEVDEIVCKKRDRLAKRDAVVYKLEGACRALDHRKSELNNLTQLWIKGYYSKPFDGRPPETGGDAAAKDVRKNLNNKQEDESGKKEE